MQEPDLAELLVGEGQLAPYVDPLGDTWSYEDLGEPIAGTDGGWVCVATLKRDVDPGDTISALCGQHPGLLAGPVELFVVLEPSSGDYLLSPSLVGDQLTYILRDVDPAAPSSVIESVIQGGAVLLSAGDPVLGSGGWTWTEFFEVTATSSGRVFVEGLALEPVTGSQRFMVAETTLGEVLMNGYEFFPDVPRRLATYRLAVSPNGMHWAASARTRQTDEDMLIQDGALVEFAPGFVAYEGEPVPSSISGNATSTWASLNDPAINDRGDLLSYNTWVGSGVGFEWIRNGRVLTLLGGDIALDQRGAAVTTGGLLSEGGQVGVDAKSINAADFFRIDVDRDGSAEVGFACQFLIDAPSLVSESALLTRGVVTSAAPGFIGILRLRNYRTDVLICDGVPNSTGQSARVITSGSIFATDNEARVDLLELPAQSNGYLLFSQQSGPGITPPGSQGMLCLSGSIGRLQSSLFTASSDGTARVPLDLRVIPQPTGTVSAMAGETWYMQSWFRDSIAGAATSNFSMAVSIMFE
ncbi:hypothetical protein Poly30_48260 [Planctomycetes bacterium Poly30]|uniref:Uncharacterized protein n=2 Tax=Saltatorellus ferox TaxID=2528018 RepID=A0A518EYV7_9BACT|nr:hypothetical protein Poly30_48260 [Planctomycetes bacterium Poly30]